MSPERVRFFLRTLLWGTAYFLLAWFGLRWSPFSGAASPVFPAAGVALAAIVLGGRRLWLAVFLGRFAAGLAEGLALPLWAELALAASNAATAVVGGYMLQRLRFGLKLANLRDVLGLVLVSVGHAAVGATLGAGVLGLALGTGGAPGWVPWVNWWASNAAGALVIAPLILSWATFRRRDADWRWWLNLGASCVAAAAVAWLVFGPTQSPVLRTFLVFPFMIMGALLCGVRGAAVVVLVVGVMTLWGTTIGYGPLVGDVAEAVAVGYRYVLVQQFLAVAAVTTLLLAVVADERRGKEALRASREELARTRERLEAALLAGDVGTCVVDLVEGKVHADRNLAVMLQLTSEEANGGTITQYLDRVMPEDRARVEEALRALQEAQRDDFQVEYRVRAAGSGVRWVLARGLVERDAAGRALRMPGVTLDVTARRLAEEEMRQREERFRQLAEAMPQIVWSADAKGQVDYINRQWFDYIGGVDSSALARAWVDVVHDDDRTEFLRRWSEAGRQGILFQSEHRYRRHDGKYRWHLTRGIPVRDANGQVIQWFGTCTDVDDMKRLTQEREALLESERAARLGAERASRLKDEFLSTVSHELRTPLNAILGWSELLNRSHDGVQASSDDLADGLAAIHRNARVQVQLIEDLLDMGRIVSGKLRLELQPVDLGDVIAAAMASVTLQAEAKGVRLQRGAHGDYGLVRGDRDRLQQVLWNLLTNAIKFTRAGGQVEVAVGAAGAMVEVAVTDTGEGIQPDFLPFVFDRFRQADGSTARRHGGLGLGLAIVKNLVELHGGTVTVTSAGEGRGSTFTLALPAIENTGSRSGLLLENGAGPDRELRAGVDLRGITVLFVDDEADTREVVERILRAAGAGVRTAAGAEEALRLLVEERPDVLVSDIGMPGTDGYELIRQVRALPATEGARVPAVALTAYARAEDREKVLNADFQAHLAKPVPPAELVAMVARLARPSA
jgi:PAS domain S-box-containing protein